jgi:hypothetical protein
MLINPSLVSDKGHQWTIDTFGVPDDELKTLSDVIRVTNEECVDKIYLTAEGDRPLVFDRITKKLVPQVFAVMFGSGGSKLATGTLVIRSQDDG